MYPGIMIPTRWRLLLGANEVHTLYVGLFIYTDISALANSPVFFFSFSFEVWVVVDFLVLVSVFLTLTA